MELIDLIKEGLKRKGLSERQASIQATGYEGTIKNLKAGREPSYKNIESLFQVLGINHTYSFDDDPPFSSEEVPKLGYVAAGGGDSIHDTAVTYTADHVMVDEHVPAPPEANIKKYGALFALEVRGASMQPTYKNGDLIYLYDDDPRQLEPEKIIGYDCVVTLEDNGEVYLKRLRRSDSGKDKEFNLESLNPAWPVMPNQRLTQALPVRFICKKV